MTWIVLLTIAVLVGFSNDWIVVRSCAERITINVELIKIVGAFRRAKDRATALVHRGQEFEDRQSHH